MLFASGQMRNKTTLYNHVEDLRGSGATQADVTHGTLTNTSEERLIVGSDMGRNACRFYAQAEQDRVTYGDHFRPSVISFAAWAKAEVTASGTGYLISRPLRLPPYYDYQLGMRGNLCFAVVATATGLASALLTWNPCGQWHHYAATYDLTTLRLYVDGELKLEDASKPGAIQYRGNVFDLGVWSIHDNEDYRGDATDMAVWSRVLLPSEISRLADPADWSYGGWLAADLVPTVVSFAGISSPPAGAKPTAWFGVCM